MSWFVSVPLCAGLSSTFKIYRKIFLPAFAEGMVGSVLKYSSPTVAGQMYVSSNSVVRLCRGKFVYCMRSLVPLSTDERELHFSQ